MDFWQYDYARIAISVLIGSCLLTISSCKTVHPKDPLSVDQSRQIIDQSILIDKAREQRYAHARVGNNIPYSVNNALLPSLSSYVKPVQPTHQRFDVTANNIPAKEFFMGLVSGTEYNMLVNPNISGTISIDLKNVTIRQTLDAIKDMYGYDYQRTSYGYEIFQPQLATKLFHLNYLDVQRTGHSYTQLTTGQISNTIGPGSSGNSSPFGGTGGGSAVPPSSTTPGGGGLGTISSIETKSEMKFWEDTEKAIKSMVSKEPGHNVSVSSLSGVISVCAYPAELKNIERYINSLQSSLNRQVILEAKILEVELDDSFQSGIDWSVLGNPTQINPLTGMINNTAGIGQGGNQTFPNTEFDDNTFTGIFALKVNGNFKTLIKLLQFQGNVQTLSNPHISTVNNQKAVIKVGTDEFFVTAVSTSNSVVGTTTLPSQNVTLTPFFSGVTLDVTPEISSDNTVVLHIHPSVSLVTNQDKTVNLGVGSTGAANTLVLPTAKSTIRESDNIVRAKNGQVIVIGGLMTNTTAETIASTPGVTNIPFIGALFRRTLQISTKSELVILLRPIIVTNKTTITQLENAKREFKILRRPFHAGGMPHVFGNEAEREVD